MDEDAMLKAASDGLLGLSERKSVAERLAAGEASEPYTLLLALGRAKATEHRALIESFLDSPDDPMLSKLALQILCKFWSQTELYLPIVRSFLEGVPWDEDGDVRQMAISVAGEHLRSHDDAELLNALIDLFENEEIDEFDRADAYVSLARAAGREWSDLPELSRLPPLDELVQPDVVSEIKHRLGFSERSH